MQYIVRRAAVPPELQADWSSAAWRGIPSLSIEQFHPRSSPHRPRTSVKLAYTDSALHAIFRVEDRYVRCIHTAYQDPVCRDSCVELFVRPRADRGYFNFELNCGGAMTLYYIKDPTIVDGVFRTFREVSPELGRQVRVATTMPPTTPAEIAEPIEWRLELLIPLHVLEEHTGPLGRLSGQRWRGNLYKCGSEMSHPHWASWAPIGEVLNFHKPETFGELVFA